MLKNIHPFALLALIFAAILLLFVACSDDDEYIQPTAVQQVQPIQQVQPVAPVAAQPVIVQQPVVQQSHDGFLTGMMAGMMMNGGDSRDVHHYHNTTRYVNTKTTSRSWFSSKPKSGTRYSTRSSSFRRR